MHSESVFFISALFAVILFIREIVAYKRILKLKYFFTPLLTLILVLLMVYSVVLYGADRYRIMILLSLIAALVADTILMIEEVDLLYNGIVFFILAHVFYIAAFTTGITFRSWNIIPVLLLLVVNFFHLKKIREKSGSISIPVIFYMLILDIMVVVALMRLNTGAGISQILAAVGALLFMMSDFILSVNAFIKKIENSTVYTWSLYAPAQFLILLSTFNI